MNSKEKKIKKKSLLRLEAIIPVSVIVLLSFFYFSYFFDANLKSGIEYIGTQVNQAEVNVGSVHTSFLQGSFKLNGLQVTDKDNPKFNTVKIGQIKFAYLWDALLRLKFVVNEASITEIEVNSPRKSPGRVLPPSPAKPSQVEKMQKEIVGQVKNQYSDKAIGDLISLLEGQDPKDQFEKIRGNLESEKKIAQLVDNLEGKQKEWDKKAKSLSDTSLLNKANDQIKEISKEKNALKQVALASKLSKTLSEVKKQHDEIKSGIKDLKSEINEVKQYPKLAENYIKEDIASLKDRMKVPKLDVEGIAMNLFAGQFSEYILKAKKYKALADEYIPKKRSKEDLAKEQFVPQKRSEGKTYKFPVTTGYPLFWLKEAAISSRANQSPFSGDLSGKITNVTTNPKLINKPAVLNIEGDFPKAEIFGVKLIAAANYHKPTPTVTAKLNVNKIKHQEKNIVNSESLKLGLKQAESTLSINTLIRDEYITMNWDNTINAKEYDIDTKSKQGKEILQNIFNSISVITVDGKAQGKVGRMSYNISSNLADEIAKGFKKQLQAKIDEE